MDIYTISKMKTRRSASVKGYRKRLSTFVKKTEQCIELFKYKSP